MFNHLLKMIWKRKSRNLMLSLEIFLAFIVVFAVSVFGVRNYQLYQMPIGFVYDDVWSVELAPAGARYMDTKINAEVMSNFKRSLEALPEVEQIAFANFSLFSMSSWRSEYYALEGGTKATIDGMQVSDDFFAVMNMSVLEGRWFSAQDEASAEPPIVINQKMAKTLFPGQSAIGKLISDAAPEDKERQVYRVTGVFDDLRNKGEYMAPTNFVITRTSMQANNANVSTMLIKLKAGTTRAFEHKLNQQLKAIYSDWGYRIAPLSDLRESQLLTYLIPLKVLSVIGVFLLVMVAFGLFGVLWQNTAQRIPEFGLRRAIGANSGDIYSQIIIEQLLLSSLSIVAALILLVQIPIAAAFGDELNWTVFLVASLISMVIIYLLSIICSIYPGWRASRFSPVEALHYE